MKTQAPKYKYAEVMQLLSELEETCKKNYSTPYFYIGMVNSMLSGLIESPYPETAAHKIRVIKSYIKDNETKD